MNYLYPELYPEMLVGINRTILDKIRFKTNLIVENKGTINLKRKSEEADGYKGGGGGVIHIDSFSSVIHDTI